MCLYIVKGKGSPDGALALGGGTESDQIVVFDKLLRCLRTVLCSSDSMPVN